MVNAAALAVAATWIAGCSPTPDPSEDQPQPTSGPDVTDAPMDQPGDLDLLNVTLMRSRALTDLSRDLLDQSQERPAAVAEVNRVLSIQTAVLSRLVQAGSISAGNSSAPGTSRPAGDAGRQTESPPSATGLTELLATQSSNTVLRDELPAVSAANIATLMSMHGTRRACVEVLTEDEVTPTLRGPADSGAITALAGLRQCQYGLQVLAARAEGQEQTTYLRALRRLGDPTQQLTELAGPAAPAAPLGYGLPGEIGTSARRRALAQQLLRAAMEAVVAGSAARSGDAAAIEGTVSLMSVVSAIGVSVGVPLTGFPGLSVPETP